ncbi:MAG: 3-keto-disaccharide hydrolase [Bacteroidota bacterium]
MHAFARCASVAIFATAFLLAACGSQEVDTIAQSASGGASTAQTGDWQVLFDGDDLDHWRGFKRDDVPAGWQIQDGVLAFVPGEDGGDLVTREQYENFELELEWRISEGGNSGIFYRVSEDSQYGRTYDTGPEMQILDDDSHADGLTEKHRTGSNYALHAPAVDAVNPVGEWNSVRIVADGAHVEHWLNGEKVVEYEQWSDEWQQLVEASKFVDFPGYGQYREGHIALQDHGDPVWFRNIRIRQLP